MLSISRHEIKPTYATLSVHQSFRYTTAPSARVFDGGIASKRHAIYLHLTRSHGMDELFIKSDEMYKEIGIFDYPLLSIVL